MNKWKFYKFIVKWDAGYLYLLPTIVISRNTHVFTCSSVLLDFDFIGFHVRWVWLKEDGK